MVDYSILFDPSMDIGARTRQGFEQGRADLRQREFQNVFSQALEGGDYEGVRNAALEYANVTPEAALGLAENMQERALAEQQAAAEAGQQGRELFRQAQEEAMPYIERAAQSQNPAEGFAMVAGMIAQRYPSIAEQIYNEGERMAALYEQNPERFTEVMTEARDADAQNLQARVITGDDGRRYWANYNNQTGQFENTGVLASQPAPLVDMPEPEVEPIILSEEDKARYGLEGDPRTYVFPRLSGGRLGEPEPVGPEREAPAPISVLSGADLSEREARQAQTQAVRFGMMLSNAHSGGQNAQENDFGTIGQIRSLTQDIEQQIRAATGAGYEQLGGFAARLAEDPEDAPAIREFFDPDIVGLQRDARLLAYSAAAALAGQTGRGLSNRDLEMFIQIVGDPASWRGSKERYLSSLRALDNELITAINAERFTNGLSPLPPGTSFLDGSALGDEQTPQQPEDEIVDYRDL